MLTIRKYCRKDRTAVQDICVETSWLKDNDTPTNRTMLTSLYSDYYTDFTDNTFVAEQEGEVTGYILACDDHADFSRKMRSLYLPLVRKLSFRQYISQKRTVRFWNKTALSGVAHMHIDITEKCQRQGVGRKLLYALARHLESKKVHTVMLLCSTENVKGCNFYKKYGFTEHSEHWGCTLFVVTLSKLLANCKPDVVQ